MAMAEARLGATHPAHHLRCAVTLLKKRGALSSAIRPHWTELLFVLDDSALFWFEMGKEANTPPLAVQHGRVDVKHIVSIQQHELPPSDHPPLDGERTDPEHQLKLTSVVNEQPLLIGSNDRDAVDLLREAITRAVTRAASGGTPAPLAAVQPELLVQLEKLGILAMGYLLKCREGFLSQRKDSMWATRLVVLTEGHVYYYRRLHREDSAPLITLGSTLRSGDYIFGERRGSMSLAHATVALETVSVDGVPHAQITLTSSPSGLSANSLIGAGMGKLARAVGPASDRFHTVLRMSDLALGAEWASMLKRSCGTHLSRSFHQLHSLISRGEVSRAASLAEKMAHTSSELFSTMSNEPPRLSQDETPTVTLDLADSSRSNLLPSGRDECDAETVTPALLTVMRERDALQAQLHAQAQQLEAHRTALAMAHASLLQIAADGSMRAADASSLAAAASAAASAVSSMLDNANLLAPSLQEPSEGGASDTSASASPGPGQTPPTPSPEAAVPSTPLLSEEASGSPEMPEDDTASGKPYVGFSVRNMAHPVAFTNGHGPEFSVREGPNYKRHGKKVASAMHVYEPASIDLLKGAKARYHLAEQLAFNPTADCDVPNETGLPRKLIINGIIPAEPPSLLGGVDGACYQVVLTFVASVHKLREWQASNSAAYKSFLRFCNEAAADPPNVELKERWKFIAKITNMKQLGLGSFEKYNGKPALITKSGSVFRGDDYLEVGMNTFRFAYVTKRGISSLLPRLNEMEIHFAVLVEGRDEDDSLPEQILAAGQLKNLDLVKSAVDPQGLPGFT
ncbi:hypothetical protein AB1Y20_001439 [Prymnesium parvum]|uniref:Protein ENHANCED DISEASE RESISTANCE 2 C-terminal domain-containing protein n=1 Tax=Prymnesium parvum TaxID=97485 RepID=A0AB34K7R7_PRYPA